jgi:diguanylate cyclase (GGDEF)-like protein
MESTYTILAACGETTLLDEIRTLIGGAYTLITASSAAETLDKVSAVPDLILLGTFMADEDSFELLVELKKNPASVNIPVILVSGFRDSGDEEKGLLLGAVDYIVKPFTGAVLRARIKTHLGIAEKMRAAETALLNDPVTGLPNRRSFDERIIIEWKRAAREKTPLSLLFVYAGESGSQNGEAGVRGGDFLKTTADILVRNARRPSDLAAQAGPEQFAVLFPNTSLNGAVKMAEEIYTQAEAALGGAGNKSAAVINIGVVSQIPQPDMSLEDFFARAEKALSQAKATGLICQD